MEDYIIFNGCCVKLIYNDREDYNVNNKYTFNI
jgi:hypothetical protein